MKKTKEQKNKITLFEGIGKEKRKVELYNFSKLDHYQTNGHFYIRVLCGNKFHYFEQHITTIAEIEIEE